MVAYGLAELGLDRQFINILMVMFMRHIVFLGILMVHSHALAANQIQNLVDQALNSGESEVTIPAGTYLVDRKLALRNVHNFSIFADDVTMVLQVRSVSMSLEDCSNVLIRGLTIDMDPLPFTQATITSHASNWSWLEAQIDVGYPQDPSSSTKLEVYDGKTGLLFPNVWTLYDASVEKLTANTIRVSGTGGFNNSDVAAGDKIVIGCPITGSHGVISTKTTNCTFEDVTLHAGTMFGFFETSCHRNQYLGIKIIPGPPPTPGGEPRLRSNNADGIHSKHASLGPRIEDCTIMSLGDDGIAINGDYDLILEATGNTVIIASKGSLEMQAGDTVRSFSTAGVLNFEAQVTSITATSGYDQTLASVLAGLDLQRPSLFQDVYRVILSASVSATPGSTLSSIDRRGNGFIVRNNYIANKRARGILIKAGEGLIESNTIEYNHMGAIVLSPELSWMESGFSRSVRIINNNITNSGLNPSNNSTTQAGVITVSAAGGSGFAPAGGHRDIEISGNRIDSSLGANIVATSISGLSITNNVLVNTHTESRNHGASRGVNTDAGVVIINCSNVTLDENTMHEFGGSTFLQAINVASLNGAGTFSTAPQSFTNYQLLHEIGPANGDDDEDQMPNLYEYFLGRDPKVVDTVSSLNGIRADASNAIFSIVSPKGGRSGIWAEVQRTTTLDPANWTAIATRDGADAWVSSITLSSHPHNTDPNLEQVEVSEPIGGIPSSFYRLSLTTTPPEPELPPLLDPITYNASAGFSGVQGSNSWYYQYYNGTGYADLTWDSTNNRWQGSATYLRIFPDGCHPENGFDVVRKWVAPDDGLITITGDISRTSSSGDGIVASIRKNAVVLWSETVLPATLATPTGVDQISINAGDAIYFMVNRNFTTTSDYTGWNPSIEFSPFDN